MSKLQELINELCPDGVIFEELSKYVDYVQPQKYMVSSTNYSDEHNIPVLTPGQTFILGYTNDEDGIYDVELNGPIILFDDFTTSKKWVDFNFKVKSSALKILIPKNETINFRYLYHMMEEINFDKGEHGRKWISKYSKIKVPIPPLEIQEEIVKILDNFTKLTAELTAELTAREKQFNYYRNNILDFNKQYEFFKLSQIGVFYSGLSGKTKKDFGSRGNFKYITFKNIFNNSKISISELEQVYVDENEKQNKVSNGDVLFTTSSESREDSGMSSIVEGIQGDVYLNSFSFGFRCLNQEQFNIRFLKHVFRSKFVRQQIVKTANGVTRYNISKKQFAEILIQVPPLEVQNEIANILDQFELLNSDLKYGLPAEIEARNKQYVYYRNKLLTFKEL